jgi:hypothetical protein
MTDDLLPDIQPSHAPALELARRHLSGLLDDLGNCQEDPQCPDAEIEDLNNQIRDARERISDLERQRMEEAK